MSTPPVRYVCVASSLFISSVCTEVPLNHKMPKSQFTWQVKKSVEIEKKALPERKQVQGEENGTKKRLSAIKRKKS